MPTPSFPFDDSLRNSPRDGRTTPRRHAGDVAQPSLAASRVAFGVLVIGALAIVLIASPFKSFELDRFFVPKELVLHATALLVLLVCAWGARATAITLDRVDTLLLAYVALSTISALLASDHVASTRALAVTWSGFVIFWSARAVARAGLRTPLVVTVIVAVVTGAATGLLQAYGLRSEYASLARAPGGTFGNRNFMAHLCVIGAPLLFWATLTARRVWGVALGTIAAMVLAGALVLSRTRAAWVALVVCMVLLAIPLWVTLRRVPGSGRRVILVGSAIGLGALSALFLPNHLNWKSDSPYLDSVRGVVDYSSGSGKGRLIQYKNTLRMAAAHPVLGVGPGNWPKYYPTFATRRDPSLSRDDGRPANPWPSSDWMAMVAERGGLATIIFVIAYFGLLVGGWRRDDDADASAGDALAPLALAGTMLATAVVGTFDAVQLLAAPTFLVWLAFGALCRPGKARHTWSPSSPGRQGWFWAATLVTALFAARSALQMRAMSTNCESPGSFVMERCRTIVHGR